MKLVFLQNYFTFINKIYQPGKGVTIGPPISNAIAEIFLKYFEGKHIKHIDIKNITFNMRYVDDILIIYDSKRIHPDFYHHEHEPDTQRHKVQHNIRKQWTNKCLRPTHNKKAH